MTTDIYLSRVGIRYIGLSNLMMTKNLSSLVFLSSDYDWGVVSVWNTSLSMKFVWLGQALFNMLLLRNGKIHDHEQTRIAAFVIISTLKSTISSWCYVSSSFCSILNFKFPLIYIYYIYEVQALVNKINLELELYSLTYHFYFLRRFCFSFKQSIVFQLTWEKSFYCNTNCSEKK